jgi:hypothetical protein
MKNQSEAFDAYIAKAAPFARPILEKLRALFHKGCPEIEETMKWSMPHFEYKGIIGAMAAFKNYVRWGFWKGSLLDVSGLELSTVGMTGMKFTQTKELGDLPSDKVILALIRQAVALNEQGVKVAKPKKKAPKPDLAAPDDLLSLLAKNKKAKATFDGFSPSHRREYVEWIVDAKQEATRQKRLATAMEWLTEGKSRNWKYTKK